MEDNIHDDTVAEVVDDARDEDPNTLLYTYGVEQKLGRRTKVQILFMFAHAVKRLLVVNLQYSGSMVDARTFAVPFNPNQTVHAILEPYITQLDSSVRSMTEKELEEVWGWLPDNIAEYYDGESDLSQFNIEDNPEEVPGSLNRDEYMAFIEFRIYPLELSPEYLDDVFAN